MNQIVDANGYTVSSGNTATCYTSFSLDANITISTSGGANCGSFWGTTTKDWRLYQAQSGDVTITASSGNTLQSVTFTYSTSNGGTLKDGTTTVATGSAQTISGSSKTYTVGNTGNKTNGQVRITAISVTYTTSGGGGTPTLSSITVKTAPDKVTYTEGENFDPTGLVITRNYSGNSSSDWAYAGHTTDFSFSPTLSTALATTDDEVTITYGGKSTTQAITVNSSGGGSGSETGTINFGSTTGSTKINSTNVTGDDDLDNTWTITTVMSETSFTSWL